jgi:hypothetical protein
MILLLARSLSFVVGVGVCFYMAGHDTGGNPHVVLVVVALLGWPLIERPPAVRRPRALAAPSVDYDQAREEYIRTGDLAALWRMQEHVTPWRDS